MPWTFFNSSGEALTNFGPVTLTDLDIDGGTDIGEAIVDADLFIVDNGAGGTNVKTAPSRIVTYVGANTDTRSGVAEAWVKYEQDSGHSAADSYNVASVADNGVGQTTITWDTDFGDADYAVTGSSVNGEVIDFLESSIAAGSIDARTRGMSDNSAVDNSNNWVVAFGDQ